MLGFTCFLPGESHAEADAVQLSDEETYYVVVRATNAINHMFYARSNGVKVLLEPLIPGQVKDGDIIGTDLDFWPYIDRLSANWDGFGEDSEEHIQVDNKGTF